VVAKILALWRGSIAIARIDFPSRATPCGRQLAPPSIVLKMPRAVVA
jgi:hypothetical protein